MAFCRALFDAIRSLNSKAVEDGGATEFHEMVEDSECPACPLARSENDRNENEVPELRQPALKVLDVSHNWPRNTSPPCMIWSKAVKEGRISCMRELLDRYPETAMDITPTTRETLLHLAVKHGHCDVVRWLVETLKRTACYGDVINGKDCSGDTVLHLATSSKQLQTLKLLLESPTHTGMVEVNARNHGGFTALDILDVLPEDREVDVEIEKILRRAGASRGRDMVEQKLDSSNHEVHIDLGNQWHHQPLPPHQQVIIRSEFLTAKYHELLLTATLLATMTFHAALRAPSNTTSIEKQDAETNHLFILFNSIAFFTSLALITILTHELPIKPWLLILLFSTTGAYMCLIKATSPHEVVSVSIIGSSILLATFIRCLALDKILLDCLQLICSRIQVI
ncbi:ankyrin repeat-containing protein NPR4 [Ricinus communis]|uniref:ankyrin repeat-containing protein NPR4 n=1 Tax=Ricinus communis TaxID=3988 RepID=UPI00201ACEC2|nr:ankyrin repeat-containing protein NPR4 [Ricinus communis]